MTHRFRLYPGHVVSLSDGQKRYIHGPKLAQLYGLAQEDCYIVREIAGEQIDESLIPLYPLRDGRYKEHLEEMKIGDFRRYYKSRKLHEFHESRSSPNPHLRGIVMKKQAASIAWHEKHWPDFRATYDRMEK